MRLLFPRRMMNLPQICSVLVIFSLVILLGFGSVGIAEAAKASGVSTTEINSAKVCGDRLCDEPMTIEEKIAEFRGESDEFVPSRSSTSDTAESLMMEMAGSLAGAIGGPIAGAAFSAIFPTDDGGADYQAALNDMEDSLKDFITAQGDIILGALSDMESSIIESISDQSDNRVLANARGHLKSWHSAHNLYLAWVTGPIHENDSNSVKLAELQSAWNNVGDFDLAVIQYQTDTDKDSQYLRIQGFPTYWMGQLMYIAYYQDQAQLDSPEDPNLSSYATEGIKTKVVEMGKQFDIAVDDAKEARADQIVVECGSDDHFIEIYDTNIEGISGKQYDTHSIENAEAYYCEIHDALAKGYKTQASQHREWYDYTWGIKGECAAGILGKFERGLLSAAGYIDKGDAKGCNWLFILDYIKDSESEQEAAEKSFKANYEAVEYEAFVSKARDDVEVNYDNYQYALDDLQSLLTTPVPEYIEPEPEEVIAEQLEEALEAIGNIIPNLPSFP